MVNKNMIIAALSLLLLFFIGCNIFQKNKIEKLIVEHNDKLGKIKDSLGGIITVKDAQITNDQESMKNLRSSLLQTEEKYNQKVKEVNSIISQKTKVMYKDKLIPYKDTIGTKRWQDSVMANCQDVISYYEDSTVLIGSTAKDSSKFFDISLTIQKKGIQVDSIKFIDSQYVIISKFKPQLFKKDTYGKFKIYQPSKTKVEIKHTNPYFENIGTDFIQFKPEKKKGYGTGLTHGVIGGTLLGLILTKYL